MIDHCINDCKNGGLAVVVHHDSYGGKTYGDGSWNDGPNFGTNKFVFVEDCILNNTFGSPPGIANGDTSADAYGSRLVTRHNFFNNTGIGTHGTDSTGRARSARAIEVYDNTFNVTIGSAFGPVRGGTEIFWGNTRPRGEIVFPAARLETNRLVFPGPRPYLEYTIGIGPAIDG